MNDVSNDGDPFSAPWTREATLQLIARLKALHESRRIVFKEIARRCLVVGRCDEGSTAVRRAQERLSRWMRASLEPDSWRLLNSHEFRRVSAFVLQAEKGTGEDHSAYCAIPDAMYFGMLAWFESDADTVHGLHKFLGDYTVYRHSFAVPGVVGVGHLAITLERSTGAIVVKETYRIASEAEGAPLVYDIRGYLGRKRGRHYVLSLHEDGNDVFMQFMYIRGVRESGGDRSRVVAFSGFLSDVQANHFYSTSFACIAGKPRTLRSIPPSELPAIVKVDLGTLPSIPMGNSALGYVASF